MITTGKNTYTTEQATMLLALDSASDWEKSGQHRIYFNYLGDFYGYKPSYYKSGNISSAMVDGEIISNGFARELENDLRNSKIWFDYNDMKFHGDVISAPIFNRCVRGIKKAAGIV